MERDDNEPWSLSAGVFSAPQRCKALLACCHLASRTAQAFLAAFDHGLTLREAPATDEIYLTESRSVGFRRVIVDAYKHTCSFCGIRIITPDGRTAVAAAHIAPWSHSHIDDPRNGIALCGLHHWVFDQGLVCVGADYQIKVSPVLTSEENVASLIVALDGRAMHLPDVQLLWPAKSALRWHVDNIFWPEVPPRLL